MNRPQILLIEDDLLSRISLEQKLLERGTVCSAISGEEVRAKINRTSFDLAFVDLDLDRKLEGLKLISHLKKRNIYTIILSAREEDNIIQTAYEQGCDDYLVKPFNKQSIELVFKKFNQKSLKSSITGILNEKFHFDHTSLNEQVETIANSLLSDDPILIKGETGTGKTFLAKLIHQLSGENLPFVQVNCSEFSEGVLESELFGHVKGAFTGAVKDKKGLLTMAHGGILFLDEVATMSMNLQKKLLKAIEEKEFYPVGSDQKVTSMFRLISATCEDLQSKIENKDFRQDLYFRIDGFQVDLRPLRERKEDIEGVIKYFIRNGERRFVFEAEALEHMKNYSWPGNIRELEKTIEVLRLKDKGIITKLDLSFLKTKSANRAQDLALNFEEIKTLGLNAYVEKIEMEIVQAILNSNKRKVRQTLTDLKLSNNSFYRIMDNIKNKEGQYA